jgi:hypothetical protein
MRGVLSVMALANLAFIVWHLSLAEKINPAMPVAQSVWIAVFAGVLTLVGVVLVGMKQQRIGSLVLIVVFAVGLVIGSSEHFFVAGPTNVFDVGNGNWALPFKLSVVTLVLLEVTGLLTAVRMLAVRFGASRHARERREIMSHLLGSSPSKIYHFLIRMIRTRNRLPPNMLPD